MARNGSSPILSRRSFGVGLGAATLTDASGALPFARARGDAIGDLEDFMRIFAVSEGRCALTNEGVIYAKRADALPEPLCGYVSVLEVRVQRLESDVFRTAQLEAMVVTDLDGEAPLLSWRNPFSGETVQPVGYISPENVYHFTPTGSFGAELPEDRHGVAPRTFRATSDAVWVTERRTNIFPSGITAAQFPRAYAGKIRKSMDLLTYRARPDALALRKRFVSAAVTMMTDAPWPLWMMQGAAEGNVLWHGFGGKYPGLTTVPARLTGIIERAYPGFLADPWRFPRAEWSTVAQLKRLYGVK